MPTGPVALPVGMIVGLVTAVADTHTVRAQTERVTAWSFMVSSHWNVLKRRCYIQAFSSIRENITDTLLCLYRQTLDMYFDERSIDFVQDSGGADRMA